MSILSGRLGVNKFYLPVLNNNTSSKEREVFKLKKQKQATEDELIDLINESNNLSIKSNKIEKESMRISDRLKEINSELNNTDDPETKNKLINEANMLNEQLKQLQNNFNDTNNEIKKIEEAIEVKDKELQNIIQFTSLPDTSSSKRLSDSILNRDNINSDILLDITKLKQEIAQKDKDRIQKELKNTDERIKQEQLQKELEEAQLKQEQLRQEQLKQEQLRQEQLKQEQLRQEQLKQEQLKQEQLRQEQLKQEQLKQEQLKQEQLKQEQLKQEQLRQEQLKQEQLRQEQLKQEQLKRIQENNEKKLALEKAKEDELLKRIQENNEKKLALEKAKEGDENFLPGSIQYLEKKSEDEYKQEYDNTDKLTIDDYIKSYPIYRTYTEYENQIKNSQMYKEIYGSKYVEFKNDRHILKRNIRLFNLSIAYLCLLNTKELNYENTYNILLKKNELEFLMPKENFAYIFNVLRNNDEQTINSNVDEITIKFMKYIKYSVVKIYNIANKTFMPLELFINLIICKNQANELLDYLDKNMITLINSLTNMNKNKSINDLINNKQINIVDGFANKINKDEQEIAQERIKLSDTNNSYMVLNDNEVTAYNIIIYNTILYIWKNNNPTIFYRFLCLCFNRILITNNGYLNDIMSYLTQDRYINHIIKFINGLHIPFQSDRKIQKIKNWKNTSLATS